MKKTVSRIMAALMVAALFVTSFAAAPKALAEDYVLPEYIEFQRDNPGYLPAENHPDQFHGVAPFLMESGESRQESQISCGKIVSAQLADMAENDIRICAITAAMPLGTGLSLFEEAHPDRFFDVGIAEGHAVTFSGGMAKDGLLPFCNIYSAFAQRAYDNIIHDLAILNLPVVICLDRAGLVGEDGPTHHGAFDLAALRPIPNLTIASPINERELRRLMYTAQLPDKGTFVIRYPRGRGVLTDWHCDFEEIPVGKGQLLRKGNDIAVLSIGPIGNQVSMAIQELQEEQFPYSVAHYDMRFLKPIDEEILEEVGQRFKYVITIEDGIRNGGMGSAVVEWMSDHQYTPRIVRLGLPDRFVEHGSVAELQSLLGIDCAGIKKAIKEIKQ